MICPACGHEQPDAAGCRRCGVIVAKFTAREARAPRRQPSPALTSRNPAPETGRRVAELLAAISAYLLMYAVYLASSGIKAAVLKATWAGFRDYSFLLLCPAALVLVLIAVGFRRWSGRGRAAAWIGEMIVGIALFIVTGALGFGAAMIAAMAFVNSQPPPTGHMAMPPAFAGAAIGLFIGLYLSPLLALVISLAVSLAWRRTMTRIERAQAVVLAGCLLLLPFYAMSARYL
jgi:hypothetical protein